MTAKEKYNHYINVPDCDMLDYMFLLRTVARGNVFEIGVRDGVSTAAFLCGLNDKDEGHLYSVDVNPHSRNVLTDKRWSFINNNSRTMETPTFPIDVLLVDGDHSYDSVMLDLLRFSPTVKPGGLILVHDVQPSDEWEPRIRAEKWYDVDGCALAWKHFCEYRKAWKSEVLPGMTGMGVVYVQ